MALKVNMFTFSSVAHISEDVKRNEHVYFCEGMTAPNRALGVVEPTFRNFGFQKA
jgi:hypothetical protein